jgi:hypothetical protein
MTPGDTVYRRTAEGCRFGRLLKVGRKYAHVDVAGKRREWPVADVKPWPPVYDAAPARPVKRGRA